MTGTYTLLIYGSPGRTACARTRARPFEKSNVPEAQISMGFSHNNTASGSLTERPKLVQVFDHAPDWVITMCWLARPHLAPGGTSFTYGFAFASVIAHWRQFS
jgi:hypothetical protein